jgi:hypothetical protein
MMAAQTTNLPEGTEMPVANTNVIDATHLANAARSKKRLAVPSLTLDNERKFK